MPAAQGRQEAGGEAKVPAGHDATQVAAPAGLKVPLGQGTGAEYMGQKEPAGHSTGVPVTQLYDAGQGTQKRRRMRWLFVSATIMLPLGSTATPEGPLNKAPVPVPSANPPFHPLPASVDTTPPGVTLRMRWLSRSATKTLPLRSKATPKG